MKKIKITVALVLLAFSITAWAGSPVNMLQGVADQVTGALSRSKASLRNNPNLVYNIVNRYMLPHVDVNAMSRSVLGGRIWSQASSAQRQQFNQQFTRLVTRTYSSALASYTNEKVKFYPVRGGYAGQSRVVVNSTIIRSGAPNIPMSYRVVNNGGSWKVYDMSVEGVSMLQSFRSQFRSELSRGNLSQLIEKLKKHNQRR